MLFKVAVIALEAFMVGCLAVSLTAFCLLAAPDWNPYGLVPIAVVVFVEGSISWQVEPPGLSDLIRDLVVRGIEGFVLAMLALGLDAVLNGRSVMTVLPPPANGETTVVAAVTLGVWFLGRDVGRILADLIDPGRVMPGGPSGERRVAGRVFGGGLLLFLLAGLSQQRVAETLGIPTGASSGPLVNVLLYFLAAVSLLALVHYTALSLTWREQGMQRATGLGETWARYTGVLLLLALAVALILPARQTLGFVDVGQWLMTWLNSLFAHTIHQMAPSSGTPPHVSQPPPVTFPHGHGPKHSPSHPLPAPDFGTVLRRAFLPLVLTALALFALRVALSVRRGNLGQGAGVLDRAVRLLSRLWGIVLRTLQAGGAFAAAHLPKPVMKAVRAPAASVPRFIRAVRLGSLSPRERIIEYYGQMVERAERVGVERVVGRTPEEFLADLTPAVPEAQGDIRGLTDAYVEARYSRHPIEERQAGEARETWQRVRAVFRSVRRT